MEPTEKRFGVFSSSIDPQQLSLTVESAVKVIAGTLVFAGVLTTADSTTLLAQVPVLITDVLALAPLAYAVWHSANIVFGLLRKAVVAFFQKKSAPVQAVEPV